MQTTFAGDQNHTPVPTVGQTHMLLTHDKEPDVLHW